MERPTIFNTKEFETLTDAFDYCRERNAPVVVIVNKQFWKLFPSGKAIELIAAN